MKRKLTALLLSVSSIFAFSSTANAEEITENGTAETTLTAYVGSLYSVTCPSEFELQSNTTQTFDITASGDIAGEQILTLSTGNTITLKQDNKADKTASVSLSKNSFTSSELSAGSKSVVSIVTPELSAGVWKSSMTIELGTDYADNITSSGNILGFSDLAEQTINGITYRISDGEIMLNGTAESVTEINLWDSMISEPLVAGETYTFAFKVNSGTKTNGDADDIKFMYTGANVVAINQGGTTATLSTDQTRCKIKVTAGTTFENYAINIWAVNGEEFKHYEKYGSASDSDEGEDAGNVPELDFAQIFALEISDTATKVTSIRTGKDALTFALLADSHVYPDYDTANSSVTQYEQLVKNIASVNSVANMDGIVHLGDHVNTQWLWANHTITNDTYHNRIYTYASKLKSAGVGPVYLVAGNHDADFLPNASSSGTEYTTYASLYSNLGSITDSTVSVTRPEWTDGSPAPYYYKDYADLGIRCIFICTNMENPNNEVKGIPYNEVVWFKETLESTPSDYDILLFGHIPFSIFYDDVTGGSTDTKNFIEILNAYNNATVWDTDGSSRDVDFTGNTSKILAYFCGHYHGDRIVMPTDEKAVLTCPEIAIASSNYIFEGVINTGDYYDNADMPAKEYGTATQDVFDIMSYVPSEGKIYLTRFGAGTDREITVK